MSPEIIVALIAIVSGGALTAFINIFLEHGKQKRAERDKSIDERIAAWQTLSDKNESRLELLEKKVEIYNSDLKSLDRYILVLEQKLLRVDPDNPLPERPVLQIDKIV